MVLGKRNGISFDGIAIIFLPTFLPHTLKFQNPRFCGMSLDDPELYPTFDELLKALQDMGTKVTTGKSAGEMRYNSLTKVVSKTQKTLFSKYKHYGIPKNATDTRDKSRVTVFGFEKNKMW